MSGDPTCNLRFVERIVETYPGSTVAKTVRVLQQAWIVIEDGSYRSYIEWRDVELVNEEKKP